MMITKKNLDASDKDFWIRYCTTRKYDREATKRLYIV